MIFRRKWWLFIIWHTFSSEVNNVDTEFININERAFHGF